MFASVAIAEDYLESDEAWMDDLLGLEPSEESEDLPSAEELAQALKELISWTFDGALVSAVGWKDNVLYANNGGVDASFAQAELDLFALRPGIGRKPELLGVLYGEFRYFDGVPGLKDESMVMLHGSSSWTGESGLKTSLVFAGMRSDQAFDASVDEFETEATSVVLWRPEFRVAFQKDFEKWGTFTATPSYAQSQYSVSSENYDTVSMKLDWTRRYGEFSKTRVQWEHFEKSYNERLSFLSAGRLGEDSVLEMSGDRFTAEWIYAKQDGMLRKLRTKAMYESEDDAVGNYYERNRWQIRESASFVFGKWNLDTSLSYGDVAYANRLVNTLTEKTRSDASWRWSATLARPIKSGIVGFLRIEGTDKKSNSNLYSYRNSGIMLGARFGEN